jgi:acid phosphatase family membrane protein YuiD
MYSYYLLAIGLRNVLQASESWMQVLNMIVEDLFQGHPVSEKKLKELLGHTPLQVGAGAILNSGLSSPSWVFT